ncbi:MAG: CNNM domain-containing protein, partial [Lachnospirales bacterium]
MDSDSSQYIVLIVCLALSGFFSGAETALTSLSKIRIRAMVEENKKNARLIQKVLDDPNKLISAILIGNNLVNITASALATVIATRLFGSNGVGIATGVLTVLVLVFGEITPKTFSRNNCELVSSIVIKPIYICTIIFTPAILILNVITGVIFKLIGNNKNENQTVTETEFLSMVDVSHEEGVLEVEEREMITNVVDFRNSDAEAIMVPRTDMVAIPDTSTYEETVEIFKKERFTKIPVYNETTDHIVGILSFKDVVFVENKEDFKVTDYMKEPFFTYESKKCSALFGEMKRESISMAIVLDEYGGTAGIVTIQDLIEEIVGDILDETR